MELGICVRDLPAAEAGRLGPFAEDRGFGYVFVPDVRGGATVTSRDAFVALAALFQSSTTVRGAVGVAAVIFHEPVALARLAATLTEQSEGRFLLGLGVSHREAAIGSGARYPSSPLAEMSRWAAEMRAASRTAPFGTGFPVLIGALGPRMLALGAGQAEGVVLNWLTPEHARTTVEQVRSAAPQGSSPLTVLYVRISPPEAVQADARNYDALVNYHQHFVAQGLTTREEIVAGTCLPPDDPGAVRERLTAYAEAGVDVVCLYPHGFDEGERQRVLSSIVV